MPRFRSARTDANQAEIVAALRQIGVEVTDLSAVGGGVPDLLLSYRGYWLLAEVIGPAKMAKFGPGKTARAKSAARSDGRNPLQVQWAARQHAHVTLLYDPEQAIRAVTLATTRIAEEPHMG
jgi:hypothetical protein